MMGRRGFFAALAGMLSAAAVRKPEPKPDPKWVTYRFDFPRVVVPESPALDLSRPWTIEYKLPPRLNEMD